MKIFLLLIPVLTALIGLLLYKKQDGRKQIFRLDLVQFIYLFVISPTMFVWIKTAFFFMIRNQLGLNLSLNEMFVLDTIMSILLFLLISVVAIHSLTKTFSIRRYHDPDFDLYHLSEYFHLWWSHIVFWSGLMLMSTFFALVNLSVPVMIEFPVWYFWGGLFAASFAGVIAFIGIVLSIPKQGNFLRIMKLILAFFFMVHVVAGFIFDPKFDQSRVGFWLSCTSFFAAIISSYFFEKKSNGFTWISQKFAHIGHGK